MVSARCGRRCCRRATRTCRAEFGYKAQVVDNADGIVLDHSVHRGNPPGAPLLAPAIARIKGLLGRAPRAVTADRGYGEAAVDDALTELGVTTVVIPRKGKPAQARRDLEHGRGFRRLVKWRTGSEGRISYLKHRYGWDRTGSTGSTAPAPGAGSVSWPTTPSRSPPCSRPQQPQPPRSPPRRGPPPGHLPRRRGRPRTGPRPTNQRPGHPPDPEDRARQPAETPVPAQPRPIRRACGTSRTGRQPAGSRKS
jgi:transposase, IS5 family